MNDGLSRELDLDTASGDSPPPEPPSLVIGARGRRRSHSACPAHLPSANQGPRRMSVPSTGRSSALRPAAAPCFQPRAPSSFSPRASRSTLGQINQSENPTELGDRRFGAEEAPKKPGIGGRWAAN
jgi:hypothetical protein